MKIEREKAVKADIIELLKKEETCAFGRIVQKLDYPYTEILENIIDLKQKGKVNIPTNNQGYFAIVS